MKNKNTKTQRNHATQQNCDTPKAQSLLRNAFDCVMQAIPEDQRHKLNHYWSNHAFLDPASQPYQAPKFGICPGFLEVNQKSGDIMPFRGFDGGFFLFDQSFVIQAPEGVLNGSVAGVLAESLMLATGDTRTEAIIRDHVASWGFSFDEPAMWAAALMASPNDLEVTFYAFRFARLRIPPPLTAHLTAIARKLEKARCPELAREILSMAENRPTSVAPNNPDQPPAQSNGTPD